MSESEVLPPEPAQPMRLILPLTQPRVVYGILGLVGLAFLAETLMGGSTRTAVLMTLGAHINVLVAQGERWRLFTAMFLHIGTMHILFNGWALYSLGKEIETLYGSLRFTVIYLLAGLFGNLAYYLIGSDATAVVVSAGASGGVFGIVGAEVAFWLRNRELFGKFGQQRLLNLALLVGINLVLGFTSAGINNLAHLGGLISGFLIAFILTPHYQVTWAWADQGMAPRLVNRTPIWLQVVVVLFAIVVLMVGLNLGDARWADLAKMFTR